MDHKSESGPNAVHLPAPTAWPMVLALGIALLVTGLVTSVAVSLLGLLLSIAAGVGWFRAVLPAEAHIMIPIVEDRIPVVSARHAIQRLPIGNISRKLLPVEAFRVTTGLKGGVAGGIAMVVPATLFSLLKYHSIWYAMNLMAAGGFVDWVGQSDAFLAQFHLQGLLAALAIHAVASLLVGLLYGAMLPMFPKSPILTAGILAPLLWSGLLYSTLGFISPILNDRIDWYWFVPSQIFFGLVCGFVVNLHSRVRTRQFQALPFALRAGLQGVIDVPQEETHHEGHEE